MHFLPPKHTQQKESPLAALFVFLSQKGQSHFCEENSLRSVPHGRQAANSSPSRRRFPALRLFPHAPRKEEPVKDFSLVTEILGGPQAETVKVFYATHMSRHTGQPLAALPLYGCRVPFTGKTFLYQCFRVCGRETLRDFVFKITFFLKKAASFPQKRNICAKLAALYCLFHAKRWCLFRQRLVKAGGEV